MDEKKNQRISIEFLYRKKLSPKEIHEEMESVLGGGAPTRSMVNYWCAKFRRVDMQSEDDTRFERFRNI